MREGWTYKKLGDICEIERGGSPRPIQQYITDDEDGLNWIKIGDAVEGSKYINSTKEKIIKEGLKKTRFVHKGDFILSNSMSFGKPYILGIDGCIHDGWLVIRDTHNHFDKSFLYYLLGSPNMYNEFKRLAVGGVVNNLNSQLVRNVFVPVPPLSEQQRIVSELDLLSSIIEKKKAQLKEYDQLAQSIFYDMFGDPVSNEKGWEVKRLGEVISVKGRVGWKGYKKEDLRESGPLAIGGGHITENGSLDFSSPVYLSMEKYEESPEIMVQRGDLIMVQRGTIGRIGLVKNEIGEATINPCVLILRPLAVSGLYVLHLMLNKIMQRCLQELVRGVAQPMITQKQVNSLIVPLPPLTLQQSFASKIEAIEQQKALVQQSITEVETLFNSRMDYYFN